MPLVTLAVVAYAAGLLAGFSAAPIAGTAAACAIIALLPAGSNHRAVRVALAGVTLAGGAIAWAQRAGDRSCLTTALGASAWRVELITAAAPGTVTRGLLERCQISVQLEVAQGSGAPGARVHVAGRASRAGAGLFVHAARVAPAGAPGPLRAARQRATAAIDRLFGEDAPLARALLVADMARLTPAMRERFAAAGLAHILSISGSHVGLVALALETILASFRVPPGRRAAVALAIVAVYVAVIGAPAPAVRATGMLVGRAVSRAMQRPTSTWAVVALGAAAPLISPRVALDPGYQLSVIGVVSLVAADGLVKRWGRDDQGWQGSAVALIAGSCLATLASAPLVAWHFGRVSLAGPLTNIVAAPIVAVMQPTLFLALATAPLTPVAQLAADAAHPMLFALDWVAGAGAALPYSRLDLMPTAVAAVVSGAFTAAVLVAAAAPERTAALVTAAAAAAVLAWLPFLPARSGFTELHVIDVGQGDAIALRTPRGRWLLFDAGGAWRTGDAGASVVVPYLARRGGAVTAFVLSHPHTDHVGGAAAVLRRLHPDDYYDAAFAGSSASYRASLVSARDGGTHWHRVHPGDSLVVDGVAVEFLAPDSAWTAGLHDANLASTIALVRAGDVRFLLVGDAELPEEEWLLANASRSLHADVLKVGHHGSSTSSGDALLDAVQPRLALISVGAVNRYGHPNAEVIRRLAAHGARTLRTDELGTIVVRTDGHRLWADAEGEEWEVPLAVHSAP